MAAIGAYIVSVSATSLICGIICSLMKESGSAKTLRMVCNLILMLAVVRPFVNHRKLDLSEIPVPKYEDGHSWIEDAQMLSRNALADIIKDRTEAYILDKAAAMGAAITVVVSVSGDEPPVPVGVEISGPVSPYLKLRLEEMIQEDLNIAKENQVWSG